MSSPYKLPGSVPRPQRFEAWIEALQRVVAHCNWGASDAKIRIRPSNRRQKIGTTGKICLGCPGIPRILFLCMHMYRYVYIYIHILIYVYIYITYVST